MLTRRRSIGGRRVGKVGDQVLVLCTFEASVCARSRVQTEWYETYKQLLILPLDRQAGDLHTSNA